MRRAPRLAACLGLLLTLVAIVTAPVSVSAHEVREVGDGRYQMVVGFLDEPVSVGDKSGLDLRVTAPADAATPVAAGEEAVRTPVEGLETTLHAEVIFADQTMALEIGPRFRDPGAYASYFYPNAAGDYSFRIFGTIGDLAVDETFSSGPDTFSAVEERLLFPADPAAPAQGAAGATLIDDGDGGFGSRGGMLVAGLGALVLAIGSLVKLQRAARRPVLARSPA